MIDVIFFQRDCCKFQYFSQGFKLHDFLKNCKNAVNNSLLIPLSLFVIKTYFAVHFTITCFYDSSAGLIPQYCKTRIMWCLCHGQVFVKKYLHPFVNLEGLCCILRWIFMNNSLLFQEISHS